ncbi:hypothetical protein JOC93_003135 [Priestia taiwanensis]|uniref:BclA C-terminal domain-containing protein n=1 Tax=Priestia taiwanensis TaxID=1347902 RepID=A0A917ERJ5_9BACI|nr:hypothetical protein [Priestia taiwanensis]GGE81118.1 hypothetical protein GCM10007140_33360 [Priestia taiwanensis]
MSSRIALNGALLPASDINAILGLSSFNNAVIATLTAGDTIELQLFGLLGAATLLAGAGATLDIIRLS